MTKIFFKDNIPDKLLVESPIFRDEHKQLLVSTFRLMTAQKGRLTRHVILYGLLLGRPLTEILEEGLTPFCHREGPHKEFAAKALHLVKFCGRDDFDERILLYLEGRSRILHRAYQTRIARVVLSDNFRPFAMLGLTVISGMVLPLLLPKFRNKIPHMDTN